MIDYKSCSLLAPGATRASLDPYPPGTDCLTIFPTQFFTTSTVDSHSFLTSTESALADRTYHKTLIDLHSILLLMLAYVRGTTSTL